MIGEKVRRLIGASEEEVEEGGGEGEVAVRGLKGDERVGVGVSGRVLQ